jgi:hypothetical protein
MSTVAMTVALTFERQDGAHRFEDGAVPGSLTIGEVTRLAVPKLRYPTTDVSSGKPLKYSLLHEGVEVPRDETVGRVFPKRKARVHIVSEYENA